MRRVKTPRATAVRLLLDDLTVCDEAVISRAQHVQDRPLEAVAAADRHEHDRGAARQRHAGRQLAAGRCRGRQRHVVHVLVGVRRREQQRAGHVATAQRAGDRAARCDRERCVRRRPCAGDAVLRDAQRVFGVVGPREVGGRTVAADRAGQRLLRAVRARSRVDLLDDARHAREVEARAERPRRAVDRQAREIVGHHERAEQVQRADVVVRVHQGNGRVAEVARLRPDPGRAARRCGGRTGLRIRQARQRLAHHRRLRGGHRCACGRGRERRRCNGRCAGCVIGAAGVGRCSAACVRRVVATAAARDDECRNRGCCQQTKRLLLQFNPRSFDAFFGR
uniref:Uncharacterized protein n=1 Tax=Burkholderia multivorans TaxID=87883 RepID=Q845T7_9BURK|nr:hypothetical protein [Burkholderia multivorans ATCC 17616]